VTQWKLLKNPLLLPYAGGAPPKSEPIIRYKVIYRTGTVHSFQWHEILGTHRIEKASELKSGVTQRGRVAAIIPEGIFEAKGLPSTFRAHDFYRSP